jgi:hypothetical protein
LGGRYSVSLVPPRAGRLHRVAVDFRFATLYFGILSKNRG